MQFLLMEGNKPSSKFSCTTIDVNLACEPTNVYTDNQYPDSVVLYCFSNPVHSLKFVFAISVNEARTSDHKQTHHNGIGTPPVKDCNERERYIHLHEYYILFQLIYT